MKPRLLAVELHHLGDAVLSLPFVRAAQKKFDVHVICRPSAVPIYELLSAPPVIHAWDPPWADDQPCGLMHAITAALDHGRSFRPMEFTGAVCAWADARVEILMASTGAGQRIGFPMTRGNYYAADLPWRRARRWLGRTLEIFWRVWNRGQSALTHPLHRESSRQPHLRCWEQIAAALGHACDYSVPWIRVSDADQPVPDQRPVLAVHAHARLPSKQWPREKWRELLSSRVIVGKFDVREIVPPGASPVTSDPSRQLVTSDLTSLVGALNSADIVLCHDSLPSHLAAALGKKVVAVFGSGEPDWFAPWRNRDFVVQKRVCPLHPCIDRCGMDSYLCLEAIRPSDVLSQLVRREAQP